MYGFFNFYIHVQVRQAGIQCPLLEYFTAVLTHAQTSPPAKEYWEKKKKLQRIKNNCMHRQLGQIMNNKTEKDQKTNYCFWGSGSNNSFCAWSLHVAPPGAGGPPQPPFWPNPWTAPTLDSFEGPTHPLLKSKQGKLLLVFAVSFCSPSPSKALPEFLICPLINCYWLKSPRTQVSNKSNTHLAETIHGILNFDLFPGQLGIAGYIAGYALVMPGAVTSHSTQQPCGHRVDKQIHLQPSVLYPDNHPVFHAQ